MPPTHAKALPWASAAGGAVLIVGTIAGQVSAGASATAAPAPERAVQSSGLPTAAVSAVTKQAAALVARAAAHDAGRTGTTTLTGTLTGTGPAKAVDPNASGFADGGYVMTMRSGGIEFYERIPRNLPMDYGMSYVDLSHDLDQEQGRCEAQGAGYWLDTAVEDGLLGVGADLPSANDVSRGYRNPTTSHEVYPNPATGNGMSDRHPGVRNFFPPGNEIVPIAATGNGVHWQAHCSSGTHGVAVGNDYEDPLGFEAAGSTTEAQVDTITGVYTGTSRAYLFGLTGGSLGFDSGSSFMQVVNKPHEAPTITYRMSYFNSGDSTGKNGITFGGSAIPIQQFADTFNTEASSAAAALTPVGPIGIATLTPEVGVSTGSGSYGITISIGHGNLGLALRDGTIGGNQGIRFGSVSFEGFYGQSG
jgi:hypothetical protein